MEQKLSELEVELKPPKYSAYELERQRTIVRNRRFLLEMSQAALRDAPVSSSSAHITFLERECCKEEAAVLESLRELEKIEQHCDN